MPFTKVSSNSFSGQTLYIGLDVHKKNWAVSILSDHHELKTMSTDPNPDVLAKFLFKNYPGANYQAVYEAGFSGFGACRHFKELGIDCRVVNPADVPTTHKEKIQKTDSIDSRKLARMLRNNEISTVHIPDVDLEMDRSLVRQRFNLSKDLTRQKIRVRALLMQYGIEIPERFTKSQYRSWTKVYMEWLRKIPEVSLQLQQVINNYIDTGVILKKQLLAVTRQIRLLSTTEAYQTNCALLNSIPGIGTLVAMNLLVQFGDINRFKRLDELCNYVGITPTMYNSGDKTVAGKLSNRGRKSTKIMLIEASWIAVRRDSALTLRFNELIKRMNKNKAIIKITKNLINRIRHVLIHQTPYELGVIK
ncbi:IS110 family transposase [Algoriphagus aquimarinus]|uniref:IS110 family transposase n=1 Tax=Algoriphagus aquimarinus TaxID=237018 RepID=UPI0030D9534A